MTFPELPAAGDPRAGQFVKRRYRPNVEEPKLCDFPSQLITPAPTFSPHERAFHLENSKLSLGLGWQAPEARLGDPGTV